MSEIKLKRYQADLMLLVVAIIWGSIFAVTKNTLSVVGPLFIIFVRFSISTVVLCILFRKKLKNVKPGELRGGILVGAILYGALVTQLIGLKYTQAGKQSFLLGTYVVMVPFLYWLFHKKKPDARAVLGAFICLAGTSLLTLNEGFSISFGDSITLLSSTFYAAHLVTTGYFLEKDDVMVFLTLQFGVVSLLSALSLFLFEPLPGSLPPETVLSLVYLALVCTLFTYFLQVLGQKFTVSTHASLILSTEAVFGSLLAVLTLGEHFTPKMIASCAAIFAAILITEFRWGGGRKELSDDLDNNFTQTQ